MANSRPSTIAELSDAASTTKIMLQNPNYSFKTWVNTASLLLEKGQEARLMGDIEDAYIKLLKGVSITLEVIPKLKDSNMNDSKYLELRKKIEVALPVLEILKPKLQQRYDDWIKSQSKDVPSTKAVANGNASRINPTDPIIPNASNQLKSASSSSSISYTPSNSMLTKIDGLSAQLSTLMPSQKSQNASSTRSVVSCSELFQVLDQKVKSVLVLDVRPMESYIQGHVRPSKCTHVVNIEPDWLASSSVTPEDIESYLESFGSSSSLPKQYFASRNSVDFIVIMDQSSPSPQSSTVLQNLIRCIYEFEFKNIPKSPPIVLCGGYQAWEAFIQSKRSIGAKESDWIEIGEGHLQSAISNSRSFDYSSGKSIEIPQRKLSIPGMAEALGNSFGPPQNLARDSYDKQSDIQPRVTLDLDRRSLASEIFENPFFTFGRGSKSEKEGDADKDSISYPILQNQPSASPNVSTPKRMSITDMDSFHVRYPDIQPTTSKIEPPKVPRKPTSLSAASNKGASPPLPRKLNNEPTASTQQTSAPSSTYLEQQNQQSNLGTHAQSVSQLKNNSSQPKLASSDGSKSAINNTPSIAASKPPLETSISQTSVLPPVSRNGSNTSLSNSYTKIQQSQSSNQSSPQIFSNSPGMPNQTQATIRPPINIPSQQQMYQYYQQGSYQQPLAMPSTGYYPNQSQSRLQQPAFAQLQQQQRLSSNVPVNLPMPAISGNSNQYPGQVSSYTSQIRPNPIPQPHQPQVPIPPPVPAAIKATSSIRRSSSPSPSPVTQRYYEPISVASTSSVAHLVPPKTGPSPSDLTTNYVSSAAVSIGVAGLKNLGNTCFLNSIIQCLSGTVPLSRYFLDGSYRRHVNHQNPLGSKGRVVESYATLVRTMWSSQETVVIPTQFKAVIGGLHASFSGNEQQDSQEFLGFLLDSLHEDLNLARKVTNEPPRKPIPESEVEKLPEGAQMEQAWLNYRQKNWSIIVDMFQGTLKSRLQCLTCGKISITFNPFMYLSLPIPEKNRNGVKGGPVFLEDCLAKFTEVEILDGEDAWFCPKCKAKRKSTKQLTISKLPTILLVHLKRFYFQGPFRNKIDTYVEFKASELDLTSILQNPTQPSGSSEQFTYDLYAVSNHFGGLNGGHYTAQVKNGYLKQWYNFDDSRVMQCQEKSVKSSAAYILFYVRTGAHVMRGVSNWWSSDAKI